MSNFKLPAPMIAAWQQAYQTRCCPPDTVLAGEGTAELDQHLQICPSCRRNLADALPEIQLDFPPLPASGQQPSPEVGELWSITKKAGEWGPKSRYYVPPVVLITAIVNAEAVNVVQVYSDPAMAGPGDILLNNALTGFAETWNRYTLKTSVLEHCLGSVSTEFVQHIENKPEDSHSEPAPGSLLWFFRQMEVETGYFFATRSIGELLDSEEHNAASIALLNNGEILLKNLAALPLVLPKNITPAASPRHILARVMPADGLLPLAAADEDYTSIRVLVFTAGADRIEDVRVVSAHLNPPHLETLVAGEDNENCAQFLHIGGSCTENLKSDCEWLFCWQSSEGVIDPLPGQFGAEKGVFWAVFAVDGLADPLQGELLVRIIEYQK